MRVSHLILIAGFLAACGGDGASDDGEACQVIEPCGGDVVGRWQLESSCATGSFLADAFESGLPDACRGSFGAFDVQPLDFIIELTADGTLNGSGSARTSITYTLSAACLAALGTPGSEATCAEVAEGNLGEEEEMVTSTCTFSNGGCDCEQSGTVDATASLPYTFEDDRLVSGEGMSPYCVEGDRLTYGDPMFGQSVARRIAD